MSKPPIQTLRAHVNLDWLQSVPHAFVLPFPAEWHGAFERIVPKKFGKNYFNLPVSELNRVLPILFKDIILLHRKAGIPNQMSPGAKWIVAKKPFSVLDVLRVVAVWGTVKFDLNPDQQRLLREALDRSVPEWTPYQWEFGARDVSRNGTFQPGGDSWTVPYLLARHTTMLNGHMSFNGEPLHLYPVIQNTIDSNRSEMISWRPFHDDDISLDLRWTWQTLPGEATPEILLHLGSKRWLTHPPTGRYQRQWQLNNTYTAYMRILTSFLGEYEPNPLFCVARLRYRSQQSEWKDDLSKILMRLDMDHAIPNASDVVSNPQRWMGDEDGLSLAITYRNFGSHPVKPGLSTFDLKDVFEQVKDLFPMLEFSNPLSATPLKRRGVSHLTREWKDISHEVRSQAFRQSVATEGTILVLAQSTEMRAAIRQTLDDIFHLAALPGISVRDDVSLRQYGDVIQGG